MTTLSKDEVIAWAREVRMDLQLQYENHPLIAKNVSEAQLETFANLCRADLVAEIAADERNLEQLTDEIGVLRAEVERLKAPLDAPKVEPLKYPHFVSCPWCDSEDRSVRRIRMGIVKCAHDWHTKDAL